MRIIVMLSPTNAWGTKTAYTNLRKFLLRDGYIRIAPEVFMRVTANRKSVEKHYNRLKEHAPKTGIVRVFHLTEKQYSNMFYLTGDADYQERTVGDNSHIML